MSDDRCRPRIDYSGLLLVIVAAMVCITFQMCDINHNIREIKNRLPERVEVPK